MKTPNLLYQYLATFSALLTILAGGMHYAWPSPSLPKLTSNSSSFQINKDTGSWIAIMELISPIPSCFVAAFLVDIIGRKKVIIMSAFPYLIGWIMIAFANSAIVLAIARLIAGISDGFAFTVLPMYIAEIADLRIRGLLASNISVIWIFGMLLINVIGSYLSISLTAAVSSVVPLIVLVTFVWMPESPYFLIMRGDFEGAKNSLEKLRNGNDTEREFLRLQEAVKDQTRNKGSIFDLIKKKSNRKSLCIMIIVRNAQQLSGVAAISFYTLSIFNEAGDFISPLSATLIYVGIQWLTTGVCSIIVDKTGRRPLLITSLIGSAIALFCEGTYFYVKDFTDIQTDSFNFVPVIALIGYVILFNIGAQPIPLLMQGELFPTDVKAAASCLSEVYFCILASCVSKFFQTIRDGIGTYLPFYVFAVCCLLNLIFVVIFVPETKGRTLEEIQYLLQPKKTVKSSNI